jgi:DNA-binding CsgD family transcriptional regulator
MLFAETVLDDHLEDALDAIRALAEKHGEAPEEHPVALYRQFWNLNRRSLSVLKNKATGEIAGYSVCVPLKESFLKKMIKLRKEKKPIKANLKASDAITYPEAGKQLNQGGNILFIVINSWQNGRLDFHAGLPLFFNMEVRFYQLRSRIILCETRRDLSKQMILASGSRPLYAAKSGDEVFYFDVGLLQDPASITSGMGVVMAHNWGPPGQFPLDLSPNQRLVARGLVEGIREKNLAAYLAKHHGLHISPHTVHEHIKSIKNKAKNRLGLEDRANIIAYLTLHHFELYPALDPRRHQTLTGLL